MLYRRIVLKFGTNLLTRGTDALDTVFMSDLIKQVAMLYNQGHEILIVSSGAVAAGRKKLNLSRNDKNLPFKQVLAAVGQIDLMQIYQQLFNQHNINIAQALLTRLDLVNRAGYLNARNTLLALIDLNIIPIINENDVVATEELEGASFGDNDNLSAMVANLVNADLLVLLSDIDGLFTSDPRTDPNARLIHRVEIIDSKIQRLAKGPRERGTGGMITKIQAAKLATECGTSVVIANGYLPDSLLRIAHGEQLGTLFTCCREKLQSRERWMLSGLASRGKIIIDSGAANAIINQNKSLLPAGVIDIEGRFQRGDLVEIIDVEGNKIGAGITNYSSKDIKVIKGLHSNEIPSVLGYDYGSEVIHRNNMAVD